MSAGGASSVPIEAAERLALSGSEDELMTLLSGLSSDAKEKLWPTVMHAAVKADSASLLERLATEGAPLNARGKFGEAPLHSAGKLERTAAVAKLIELGASTADVDEDGDTPLHAAARAGSVECVDLLIRAGADVHARNFLEETPLYCAAWTTTGAAGLPLLLAAGGAVHASTVAGWTPLHSALHSACIDNALILVKHGADLETPNKRGRTALECADAEVSESAKDALRAVAETRQAKEARDRVAASGPPPPPRVALARPAKPSPPPRDGDESFGAVVAVAAACALFAILVGFYAL